MGKWKAIAPFALGLVIALSAGILVYKWLNVQTTQEAVTKAKIKSDIVPVAVAAADLPWGTKLAPEMIKTLPYLKESIPPGSFLDTELLKGRVVISPLRQNEPVLECRLAPDSVTMGGVSAIVKPGKRALAVKGDKVIGLSGFIKPGNRVDVLVTITNPSNKMEMTKTVLENILVLATGIEIEENKEGGKPQSVDVYTLEVTPREGENLSLAATNGKLHFALRNVIDKETVLTNGATVSGTLAAFRPKERQRAANTTYTVEAIKGCDVRKDKFKL
ncbi:MAG: Flp pilus assembly protein CpaB [Desulfobacterales bacterium]|nr:Flp pilus assembly protein CpaB [Desulfobacterales bacterium]